MLSNSLSLAFLFCFSMKTAFAGSNSQEETLGLSKATPLKISIGHPLEPNFEFPLPEGVTFTQDTVRTLLDKIDMTVRQAHGLLCVQTRARPIGPEKAHNNQNFRAKPY